MINPNQNISFTSRNRVIRKADDIARRVSSEYIPLSVTKYYDMPTSQKYVNALAEIGALPFLKRGNDDVIELEIEELFLEKRISEQKYHFLLKALAYARSLLKYDQCLNNVRKVLCKLEYDNNLSSKEKVRKYLDTAKKSRIGNCGECVDVAMILAYFSKIKDVYSASVMTKSNKGLDHGVLYVENDGRPYIIDAWLGFADYLDNTIYKYKSLYRNYFPVDDIVIVKDRYNRMGEILKGYKEKSTA